MFRCGYLLTKNNFSRYTPNGRSPNLPSSTTKKPRRRVATVSQRRAANIRERRRMFNLNEAFDKLRRKVSCIRVDCYCDRGPCDYIVDFVWERLSFVINCYASLTFVNPHSHSNVCVFINAKRFWMSRMNAWIWGPLIALIFFKFIGQSLLRRCQLSLTRNDFQGSKRCVWPSLTLRSWESCLESNRAVQSRSTFRGNTTCPIKPKKKKKEKRKIGNIRMKIRNGKVSIFYSIISVFHYF